VLLPAPSGIGVFRRVKLKGSLDTIPPPSGNIAKNATPVEQEVLKER
jgi:hypothetical protein